eukprot:TRINITY_DN8843_c0_g1_i1.p1 TRINITY_DN8843_c0_g1~~TRINITY_DN8843_c0_g1_i1.p1  ORF type:complete len:145 (-),score=16.55 TRINITY_DN8843_c0_g1_i1:17-451(-)
MLLASIPNPLFDLAGLTCGHLLVPFLTFFIPTLIGKAINKVSLQAVFVIMVFNTETLKTVLAFLESWFPMLKDFMEEKFDNVRKQFHRVPGAAYQVPPKHILSRVWDVILIVMILYFVISIVNSRAQEYLVRSQNKLANDKKSR